ncbi:MAG TPA: hypothetical protein VKV39_06620 [Candidatus Sulfotelmatobacter sp.]|nr:hypothetical protein [Candidatus Sulfotelmatobacter sp.]
MTKYLKAAASLLIAVVCLQIAGLAQSTSPGAVKVFDGSNHLLGTLVSVTPTTGNTAPDGFVLFRNGYFIAMGFTGKLPAGFQSNTVYWTGANCTGDPYLYAGDQATMSRRMVIWDGLAANSLYVPSGTGEEAAAVKMPQVGSAEGEATQAGTSYCTNEVQPNITAFLLSPFDPVKVLGWNLSGTPLRATGPLQFKEK